VAGNAPEHLSDACLFFPGQDGLEAVAVHVFTAEHAGGAAAAAPALEELEGDPLGEAFLEFGREVGGAALALPGVSVLVGEDFEEDYLGEAVLHEDGAVATFAQEEAEAAAPAVGVEAVEGGLVYEAEHLAAANDFELARLAQLQAKSAEEA